MNVSVHSKADTAVTYIHNRPASFKSQFLQLMMMIIGTKKRIEKKLNAKKIFSEAAELPKILRNNFILQVDEINQRKVWTLRPEQNPSQNVVLYIHGGAYISNLTKYDWKLIEELLIKTKSTLVVPDYPLAPASNYKDVYDYFESLYFSLIAKEPKQKIIFMGNSAGGGFALGFAQKLKNENRPQPSQIILISPWLDITMSNPDVIEVDKKDRLLSIRGLQIAGQLYADTLDRRDFRVSPIYGDFSGLGKISLFIGTHDLFVADARKLKDRLYNENIPLNYFEYPKMFHVWVAVTGLKESQHAIEQITTLINSEGVKEEK